MQTEAGKVYETIRDSKTVAVFASYSDRFTLRRHFSEPPKN
jgi:hypothetical protein